MKQVNAISLVEAQAAVMVVRMVIIQAKNRAHCCRRHDDFQHIRSPTQQRSDSFERFRSRTQQR